MNFDAHDREGLPGDEGRERVEKFEGEMHRGESEEAEEDDSETSRTRKQSVSERVNASVRERS